LLRSKREVLRIKINISKKLLTRLAIFTALVIAAIFFDVYFENDSLGVNQIETSQEENQNTPGNIYLFAQSNTINAKSSVQKIQFRRIQLKSHDKLIQRYHQLRNYQVLKAEVETDTTPIITSYHYLVFQQHFFSSLKDEPLIS